MESQTAKGKTEFFDKLKAELSKNGGGTVNDRGRIETIGGEGQTNFDWRKAWALKSKLERPKDRLPRGVKVVGMRVINYVQRKEV